MKGYLLGVLTALAVGGAYYAGSQRGTAEAAPKAEPEVKAPVTLAPAEPATVTFKNPTNVLLGLKPLPDVPSATEAEPDVKLIVPELGKQ